ncbi:hypothetical protein MNBD_CHLOROFLEXI01-140 [hydrothermal vent metagenome]|uniref:Uncharacterized protein n=1 Tax=hydrothermal vent metagenome TaxID=652676 RepID=A0A3B0VPZ8_9ZZZZ
MKKQRNSETGHVNILVATLLAAIGVVVLAWGASSGNSILIWLGGIGTAVFLLGQFAMVHAELGKLWQRIDALEKKK